MIDGILDFIGDLFDWVVDVGMLIVSAIVIAGLIGLGIWACAYDSNMAIKYNRQFSQQCKAAGGTPVIGDSDACFKDHRIIFQEHNSDN